MVSKLSSRTEYSAPKRELTKPGGTLSSQGRLCHVYIPHLLEDTLHFLYNRERALKKGNTDHRDYRLWAYRSNHNTPRPPTFWPTVGIRRNSEATDISPPKSLGKLMKEDTHTVTCPRQKGAGWGERLNTGLKSNVFRMRAWAQGGDLSRPPFH